MNAKPRSMGFGDERWATVSVGRLLIGGGAALVLAVVPAPFAGLVETTTTGSIPNGMLNGVLARTRVSGLAA